MSKHTRPLIAFLMLAMAALACDLPIPTVPGTPRTSSSTATPPFSPDDIGTVVAMTLTSMVPAEDSGSVTATALSPEGSPGLLPGSIYFLAPDSAALMQVFRMDADGSEPRQITTESVEVVDYDVSRVDGSLVFVANNQLILIQADGSDRQVLVDGGAVDVNNPFISTINSPVFSPDGQSLAYGYKGLQLYSFATGTSELKIENQIDDVGGGLFVPRELYEPERYSPDGTKLLITLGYYEGASSAVYSPASGEVVRLTGGEGALICCDDTEWAADGASFYSANPTMGMFSSGLWRVDAATGAVTTLIPGDAGGGSYNLADEAYLAPDGQLYFLFATASSPEGIITRSPLQAVRSAPDGVTGRTILSTESFELLNEALWAPDASFLVAVIAPSPEIYQGGEAKIVYFDGRPSALLTPFAQRMKWGP